MTSSILRTATRLLMPLLLMFAVYLVLRGHNEPGGGFVGGLVVAGAFILYAIAYGADAARRALLVDPSRLLGVGLLVALASGIPAVLRGQPFLTSVWTAVGGDAHGIAVGTPLVFDVGVCFAVIGVVLTIVFTLADVVLD